MKTISKNLIRAAKIACRRNTRPTLAGVFVSNNEIMASDSFKLLIIDRKKEKGEYPLDQYPVLEGTKPVQDLTKGVILPAAPLLKDAEFFDKETLPVLRTGILCDETETTMTLETTNLEFVKRTVLRKIDGTFPDCWKLIRDEKEKKSVQVKLDPRLLIQLLEAFKDKRGVVLSVSDERSPIILESEEMTGLLMSLKFQTPTE